MVDCSGKLADVFETAVLKELQDLPVPFVVFERVNAVLLWFDATREHPVGQGHGRDNGDLLAGRSRGVEARLCKHGGLGAVGVDV